MRNLDSKIHLPGFDPFKFQFHSFFAETFLTASVNRVDSAMSVLRPLMLQERRQSGHGNTSRSCHNRPQAGVQKSWSVDRLNLGQVTRRHPR
jgi:hypothetical protein